ncbi:three component ABC system middle component [Shewanella bicestrii]
MNRVLNNEATGLLAIQSVLSFLGSVNIAIAYLIIPLVFDKKIRNLLKRKNTFILSAQELVTSKSDYFIGFNEKFTDSLIISTNAILMGKELGLFSLEKEILIYTGFQDGSEDELGNKINDIILASENICKFLTDEPEELYSLLRLKI